MSEANVVSQPHPTAPAFDLRASSGVVPLSPNDRIAKWQQLQFGLFLHWGVYSIYEGSYQGTPQTIGYPEQIKAWMNIPDDDYLNAAHAWTAEDWNPAEICEIAQNAGMSYVMITTKHHDGFCMWDTATTDFNIVKNSAFGRDPLAELATECAARGLKLAFYFSIIDWTQHEAEPYANLNAIPERMMPYVQAQIEELLSHYGPIAEFWFDMGGPTPDQSQRLADTVRRCQPETTVMNSRVWNDRGDFEVGGDNDIPPFFQYGPWESVRSIFPVAWSYCITAKCDRSPETIPDQVSAAINDLVSVMTGGGQFAYNLGPMPSGAIDAYDRAVMDGIAEWMHRHPHAIRGARPTWIPIPDWGRISTNGHTLFLFPHHWENGKELRIQGVANAATTATIDGTDISLPLRREGHDLIVTMRADTPDPVRSVISVALDGELRFAPANSAALTRQENGTFHANITAEMFTKHRTAKGYSGGFAAIDAYLANTHEAPANALQVAFSFSENHAPNPTALYALSFADDTLTVTGAQLLGGPIQTQWNIPARSIDRLRIEYAQIDDVHSPYYAASLDFQIDSIDVRGYEQAPPASAPLVTVQPASQRLFPGDSAIIAAGAHAWPLPTYRWYQLPASGTHDSGTATAIACDTSAPYVHVTPDEETTYFVEVSNPHGSVLSEAATVSFASAQEQRGTPPTVGAISVETVMGEKMTASGDGANRIVTVETGTVLGCQVDVSGTPYPHIQWQVLPHGEVDWKDLDNQNAPTWTRVTDAQLHQAKVRVVVTNTAGSATSGMITVILT